MRNRAICLSLVWLLGAGLAAGCARAVEPPRGRVGVNLFYARRYDPESDRAVLDGLKQVRGLHWVREEISLSEVAPRPDVRDFKKYDAAFDTLRAHDLYPLILISDPPAWIRSDLENQLPGVALEVVKRYHRCCSRHYQILNEVNTARFWGGPPDPAAYARALQKVYRVVKKEFPEVTIVAAGLATSDVLYLKDFADAGGLKGADAIAVHPYTFPVPFVGWDELALTDFQALAGATPVWVTEIGWPTADHAEGVTESEQAAYLLHSIPALQVHGVERVFWYDYRDDGADSKAVESNFGLIRRDNSPKLAVRPFVRLVSGTRPVAFRKHIRTLAPVAEFAKGFNYRYHAEQFKDGHSVLYDTPAELKGWTDLDHACLEMNVESTDEDPAKPGTRPDGLLLGYELQDQNKTQLQGIFGRIYWVGERKMVAPVRLRDPSTGSLLVPPIALTGLVLQASTMYKGGGLHEGVITVSEMSTCEYHMSGY